MNMLIHICNPSTQEAEGRRSQVWKFGAILDYTVKLYQILPPNKTKQTKKLPSKETSNQWLHKRTKRHLKGCPATKEAEAGGARVQCQSRQQGPCLKKQGRYKETEAGWRDGWRALTALPNHPKFSSQKPHRELTTTCNSAPGAQHLLLTSTGTQCPTFTQTDTHKKTKDLKWF